MRRTMWWMFLTQAALAETPRLVVHTGVHVVATIDGAPASDVDPMPGQRFHETPERSTLALHTAAGELLIERQIWLPRGHEVHCVWIRSELTCPMSRVWSEDEASVHRSWGLDHPMSLAVHSPGDLLVTLDQEVPFDVGGARRALFAVKPGRQPLELAQRGKNSAFASGIFEASSARVTELHIDEDYLARFTAPAQWVKGGGPTVPTMGMPTAVQAAGTDVFSQASGVRSVGVPEPHQWTNAGPKDPPEGRTTVTVLAPDGRWSDLYLDGTLVAEVRHHGRATFEVSHGPHQLQVREYLDRNAWLIGQLDTTGLDSMTLEIKAEQGITARPQDCWQPWR